MYVGSIVMQSAFSWKRTYKIDYLHIMFFIAENIVFIYNIINNKILKLKIYKKNINCFTVMTISQFEFQK